MQKVVMLSAFLSPHRSGAEACVEEVALELSDQFDITIITARLDRALPKRDTLKGRVPVIRVGIGNGFDKWLFPFLAPFKVRKFKPDIVHAVLESYAGMAMIVSKWLWKATYILTCQSTNTWIFVRWMHRAADIVTVISSALQKRASRFKRDDAVLIPNGLRLDAVPQREKVLGRILFVGRLEKMKGIDTLLKAFAKLPSHTTLRIVGDGSLRKSLEAQAEELQISDRVTFTGSLPHPEVYEEFARAEIFCGLSRSEALGNVFLEAQAAGCAVVATNVGGIPDIVEDGKTGILIAPDDVRAAASALSTLLEDDQLRRRMGEAGRENARGYDWGEIGERYGDLMAG